MRFGSDHGWSFGRLVPALILATLTSGIAGCALQQTHPPLTTAASTQNEGPYLLLRLGERRVYLKGDTGFPDDRGFPVAIGQPRWPTPTGRFQITEMVENPDFTVFDFNNPGFANKGRIPPGINNPLGLRWIAFTHAHGWTIGFHGTQKTSVLGQAVSHGCVRMANPDVVKIFARVKVGTPVIVEP
jgi:lipoprotein-anchoring transpeptidase ErfK/SrfK